MADRNGKKTIFRPNKGRAVLRFFIGLLMLTIVLGTLYIFMSDGDLLRSAIERTASTPPVETLDPYETAPPEATGALTETYTPAETNTYIPTSSPDDLVFVPAMYTGPSETVPPNIFAQAVEEIALPGPGGDIKYEIFDFNIISNMTQSVVNISVRTYLTGLDAANTSMYLVALDESGNEFGVYTIPPSNKLFGDTLDASEGVNLESACYTAYLNVEDYTNGVFRLAIALVNGEQAGYAALGDQYAFAMFDGEVEPYAGE